MPSPSPLMSALSWFESEVRATTPFDMFGLVLPFSDGRMTFELWNESCAAVHVLAIEEIPEPLRRAAPMATQFPDFSALRRPDSVIDRLLAPYRRIFVKVAGSTTSSTMRRRQPKPIAWPRSAGIGRFYACRFDSRIGSSRR